MIKLSYPVLPDKQNPLFQQHSIFGHVHTRDYAFYMRKLAFMQQQLKGTAEKKNETHHNNNG
jgi:hypothetical protein